MNNLKSVFKLFVKISVPLFVALAFFTNTRNWIADIVEANK